MGVEALEGLMKRIEPVRLDDDVLFALLVYSGYLRKSPLASPKTKETAARLLEQQFSIPGSPTKEKFIIDSILQKYLRPLFSKSKPASVTASGRRAEYPDTPTRGESMPDDSALTKPWKYTDLRAIPALFWVIHEADVS